MLVKTVQPRFETFFIHLNTSKYCTCSPAAFIHQILLWQWREFPHVIGVFQKTDSPADLEKMITDILGKLNRTSRGITLPWF